MHKQNGGGPEGKWEVLQFFHLKPECLKQMPGEMIEELVNKQWTVPTMQDLVRKLE